MKLSKEQMEEEIRREAWKKSYARDEEAKRFLAEKHKPAKPASSGKFNDPRHVELVNKLSKDYADWKKNNDLEKEKAKLDEAFAKCQQSLSESWELVNKLSNAGMLFKKR